MQSSLASDMRSTTSLRAPNPGDHASGHDVHGIIASVSPRQPLAADGVWRVTLRGESFGRLVRLAPDAGWHLLQLDELTDAQLDALEAEPLAPHSR